MVIESFPQKNSGDKYFEVGGQLLKKVTDLSELLANGYNPKEYSEMYISGEDAKATQYLLIKEDGKEVRAKIVKKLGKGNDDDSRTGRKGYGVFQT